MKKLAILLIGLSTLISKAEIVNYEMEGNLEASSPIGCISIDELKNTHTPADIFTGVQECVLKEDYAKAVDLYFVARTYGYFDTKRVTDKSSHQAVRVLLINTFSNIDGIKREKMSQNLKASFKENSLLCNKLEKIGKPNYYPRYMIQHGLNAFLGNADKSPLASPFDADKEWKASLQEYLKCHL
ncbi:Uncharacterised protein [Phocoenobacter uteri]|uniref:Uncharacterized protein n=1 Tax=Phocoenobacter uteri TaxID=146806 RepID=A0A379C8J8_9PAST|nr:hypothetical protein [Phocoenobacter uteri]MDG6882426.1 hypothetical protein [Phocoenobacter uteri]SUB58584.1 Uncharacterised protein [Phocoenobacter uteri]